MDALDTMITALAAPGRLLPEPPVWKVKTMIFGGKEGVRVLHYEFTTRGDLDAYVEWRSGPTAAIDVQGPGVDYYSGVDGPWVRLER